MTEEDGRAIGDSVEEGEVVDLRTRGLWRGRSFILVTGGGSRVVDTECVRHNYLGAFGGILPFVQITTMTLRLRIY